VIVFEDKEQTTKIAEKVKLSKDHVLSVIAIFMDEVRRDLIDNKSIDIKNFIIIRFVRDIHTKSKVSGLILRQKVSIRVQRNLVDILKKHLDLDTVRNSDSLEMSDGQEGFEEENVDE
jgi:hypothetical protein